MEIIGVKNLHGSINFELRIVNFCLFVDCLVKTKMVLKRFGKVRELQFDQMAEKKSLL